MARLHKIIHRLCCEQFLERTTFYLVGVTFVTRLRYFSTIMQLIFACQHPRSSHKKSLICEIQSVISTGQNRKCVTLQQQWQSQLSTVRWSSAAVWPAICRNSFGSWSTFLRWINVWETLKEAVILRQRAHPLRETRRQPHRWSWPFIY